MSSNWSVIELIELLRKSADELDTLQGQAAKDASEIRKRDDIIDELRDEVDMLKANIKRLEGGAADEEPNASEMISQLFDHVRLKGTRMDLFADETFAYGNVWVMLDSENGKQIECDGAKVDVVNKAGIITYREGGYRELKNLYDCVFNQREEVRRESN